MKAEIDLLIVRAHQLVGLIEVIQQRTEEFDKRNDGNVIQDMVNRGLLDIANSLGKVSTRLEKFTSVVWANSGGIEQLLKEKHGKDSIDPSRRE